MSTQTPYHRHDFRRELCRRIEHPTHLTIHKKHTSKIALYSLIKDLLNFDHIFVPYSHKNIILSPPSIFIEICFLNTTIIHQSHVTNKLIFHHKQVMSQAYCIATAHLLHYKFHASFRSSRVLYRTRSLHFI